MNVTIKTMPGDHISKVAENAVERVAAGWESVSFNFNGITLTVRAGITAADVVAEYHRESNARHKAYVASDEYKRWQREAEECDRRRKVALDEALARSPEKMTLRDPDGWAKECAANPDGYGGAVMLYVERWARLMEGAISAGSTVDGCAKEMSHIADVDGITGFMYGCAVSTLAQVWAHGEALRRWHNLDTQIGNEGEKANESGGVLNPALLSIGKEGT